MTQYPNPPAALHHLARTWGSDSGLLDEACERLPKPDLERIIAWAIEVSHPEALKSHTTSQALAGLARWYYNEHLNGGGRR